MADVFISYAREDQAFVRRVFEALKGFGRETWVDWEGIPPSAVWMAEVRKAIEGGEAFVFVISPDSLASSVCREEVAHAASVNKRLIPILHREVGETPAPETVAERNWIFLREEDDFDRGIEQLVEALAADPDWLERHTRLLVRAREWEQRKRPKSLLLRGDDLRDAEQWLASATGKEPSPTPLHAELVIASRRAAGHRQRLTLAGVGVALIVSLVLSGFALVQRSAAVRERERAEEEARTSRSRELAAQALAQIDVDPELGVLLALEATDVAPTAEAEAALRRTMGGSHIRATLRGHEGSVQDVAYSPDGSTILTAGFDGTARLWDATTFVPVAVLEGHEGALVAGVFSPDGTLVATASEDRTMRLWDAGTGAQVHTLVGHEDPLTALAFSADGATLVTGSRDGTARLWRVADGEPLATLDAGSSVTSVATASDGEIATGEADGVVRLWDADGRALAELRGHRDTVTSLAFGPSILLSTSEDGTARLWSVPDRRPMIVLEGHTNEVLAGAVSPDGAHVATAAADGTARIWSVATGQQTAGLVQHDGPGVLDVAFDASGDRVGTAGDDGTARIWSVATGEELVTFRGHAEDVHAVAFDPTGASVVTGSGDATAKVWNARGATLAIFAGHRDWVWNAYFDDPEERVVTAGKDGTARVWDAETGEQLHVLEVSAEPLYSAAALHDGERAVTSGQDGVVRVWDIETERLLLELDGHDVPIGSIDVSPDDARAVTGGDDGTARLWDLDTGETVAVLPHGPPTVVWVSPVLFGPDASFVVTGTQQNDATVRVWDLSGAEPRLLHELVGHEPGIKTLALSADGSRLLTAGTDPDARIWDPATGRNLATLHVPTGAPSFGDLSDDGLRALVVSDDGSARVWDARTGELLHEFRIAAGTPAFGDLSADGTRVVVGDSNGVVYVWSATTGAELATFEAHVGRAWPSFNSDGSKILTWGDDGLAKVLSCDLCAPLPELKGLARERLTRALNPEERAEFLGEPAT